jgi:hypothetical protein
LMSAPAAKARSEPVMTTAETVVEDWKARRAVLSSAMSGVQSALRALGRLRVTAGEGASQCLFVCQESIEAAAAVVPCPTPGRGSETSMYS